MPGSDEQGEHEWERAGSGVLLSRLGWSEPSEGARARWQAVNHHRKWPLLRVDEAAARIVEVLRAAFLPHPALLADTFGLFPSAADAVDLDDWPEWTED